MHQERRALWCAHTCGGCTPDAAAIAGAATLQEAGVDQVERLLGVRRGHARRGAVPDGGEEGVGEGRRHGICVRVRALRRAGGVKEAQEAF